MSSEHGSKGTFRSSGFVPSAQEATVGFWRYYGCPESPFLLGICPLPDLDCGSVVFPGFDSVAVWPWKSFGDTGRKREGNAWDVSLLLFAGPGGVSSGSRAHWMPHQCPVSVGDPTVWCGLHPWSENSTSPLLLSEGTLPCCCWSLAVAVAPTWPSVSPLLHPCVNASWHEDPPAGRPGVFPGS